MRVLVTGASGFVGYPLVEALSRAKYDVHAAIRSTRRLAFPKGVHVIVHPDLALPFDWTRLLAGVDAVVHLAGIAHTGHHASEALYDRINCLATTELAAAAKQAAVKRFIFVSSIRAQSGPAVDHVLTEDSEPRPTDAYGRSKLAAEAAVRSSGIPFTILRPVLIYGPGAKGNLGALIRLAAVTAPLPFGAFDNRRSLLDRSNLIAAIQFALQSRACEGELYLVADRDPVSLAEIITAIRQGLGRKPALFNVPPVVVESLLGAIGRRDLWDRLGGSLVATPQKLIDVGWCPQTNTKSEITAIVRAVPKIHK
jgi:nucleoside-diphosphate-sugar epimerase